MTEASDIQEKEKGGVDGVAIIGGAGAGAASAWGAVELAKNYVVSKYDELSIAHVTYKGDYKNALRENRATPETHSSEHINFLKQKAIEAKERIPEIKELTQHQQLVIAGATFVTVALLVGFGINWWNNRESPTAVVAPETVELAQQKLMQDAPEQQHAGAK